MSRGISLFPAVLLFMSAVFSLSLYASESQTLEPLTLKLPGSASIKFQPIFLGLDGDKLFTSRIVKLGSRDSIDASYKESPSTAKLGGAFTEIKKNGDNDWFYYLGQTEVSVKQWNAVMRWWLDKNELEVELEKDSDLPQTGKTPAEIFTFIEVLNIYLLQNQKQSLPRNGNAIAYARLPTEVEWAFAARGGIAVEQSVFDRPYPYVDEDDTMTLAGYEWHRLSAGKEMKETGSKKPNPLGLYDMLGNVEELTYGIFGHDFLFARYGGLVVRGGSFSDHPNDLKVSRRAEYKGYKPDGEVLRWPKIGFRLALGTLVSETGHTYEELDQGLKDYNSSEVGVTQSAAVGDTSLSEQSYTDQINHYNKQIKHLTEEVANLLQRNTSIESEFAFLQGELEKKSGDVGVLQRELEAERAKSEKYLAKLAKTNSNDQEQDNLIKMKESEISQLQVEQAQLARTISELRAQIKTAEVSQKLVLVLQQKIYDSTRRESNANFEIEKNQKRVVVAEKRLLEALVRIAGYNLYAAWRNLIRIEIKKKAGNYPKTWEINKIEAENMLKEYQRYVIQIVDNTDDRLFPEVKSEVIRWLEKNNASHQQINGMSLIERHIKEIKKGKYIQVDYLYRNLLNEPEMKD